MAYLRKGTAFYPSTVTAGTLGSGVTGGAGLSGSTSLGTVTVGNLSHADIVYPAGHIINTTYTQQDFENVETGDTTEHAIESSSGVTWEATITTVSTSNHILVIPNINIVAGDDTTNSRAHLHSYLDKASGGYNIVYTGTNNVGVYDYGGSGVFSNRNYTPIFRVSPSFEGLCSFKFTLHPSDATAVFKINYPSTAQYSSITLMEIQG